MAEPACNARDTCGCHEIPSIVAKYATKCGDIEIWASATNPADGPESPMRYAKVESAQPAILYDRTGPGFTLVTTPCTISGFTDSDKNGNGYRVFSCGDPDDPLRGEFDFGSSGCSGAALCGALPGPGQKCYVENGAPVLTYSKGVNTSAAALLGLASGAPWVEDPDYQEEEDWLTTAVGMTALAGLPVVSHRWKLRRRGRRVPAHLIFEVANDDGLGTITVEEILVTLPANESEVEFVLMATGTESGASAIILSITGPTFGRAPTV